MKEHSEEIVRAKTEIIGVDVKNMSDDALGKIEDIVLEKISGHVRYIILSFGGILGMGDKFFALPWNAIHYSCEKKCFVLEVSKEKLKQAPGFDKDHWPNMADKSWGNEIQRYYSESSREEN